MGQRVAGRSKEGRRKQVGSLSGFLVLDDLLDFLVATRGPAGSLRLSTLGVRTPELSGIRESGGAKPPGQPRACVDGFRLACIS